MIEVKDMTNTNSFEDLYKEMNDVAFIVECDGSHDQFNLWQAWSAQRKSNMKSLSDDEMTKLSIFLCQDDVVLNKIRATNKAIIDDNRHRIDWEQISSGFMILLGPYKFEEETLPISIEIGFAMIKGHKVCFYNSPSRLVHHGIVEDYMRKHFQKTCENYSRWCHTTSDNFHNCVDRLDKLDKEPRDTSDNLNRMKAELLEKIERNNDSSNKINLEIQEIDTKLKSLVQ